MKYIGLDLHKKSIFATVLGGDGKILSRTKIGSNSRDIIYYLKSQGTKDELSVAMEASYNWQYFYRAVEEAADAIVLAHPLKTRIIGEAKIKTDKIDSSVLAHMLKAEMLPAAYVPKRSTMQSKMLLRSRISLVRIRTQVKNKIHAIIDKNKDSYTGLENLSDIFGKAGCQILRDTKISPIDYQILSGYLDLIDEINKKIKDLESKIDKRSLNDKEIELLKTIPGIGTFTAFLIKTEIDDIARFLSKEKLCCYAGLVPSTHGSADKLYHGRIVKQGNKFLRWALTEAAQVSIRYSEYFRYYYSKVRSKKNANSATIAVARRMLEVIYAMLKEGRAYIEKPVDIK
ncbi:IS110 family transposase [Candidatus Woesearchaeota archaeon]|nr:IS110 family transposase [Candidatus Woesearchaeota archaeon]